MLKIYFGNMDNVAYGPTWFKYNYDLSWFQDPFVQKMIEVIDKTKYVTGGVFDSPVLGRLPRNGSQGE